MEGNRVCTLQRAVAGVLCAASLALCFHQGWTRAEGAMDLFGYYGPGKAWLLGLDAYDRRVFSELVAKLFPGHAIGDTACPLLPGALVMFAPLASLPVSTAAHVMWVASFAALLFSLYAMLRLWAAHWDLGVKLLFAALLMQSRLIQSVAYRGQPSLLVLALVIGALWAAERDRPVLAGFIAALGAIKFPLLLPLAGLWLWERRYRALLAATLFGASFSLPVLVELGLTRFLHGFTDSVAFISTYNATDPYGWHQTSWQVLLRFLPAPLASSLGLFLPVLALALLFWPRADGSRPKPAWIFAALTTLGMLAVYHRVYDAVALFPVLVIALSALAAPGGLRDKPLQVLSVALLALLIGFAPQSVAERSAAWMSLHARALEPINVWLTLVSFVALVWLLRRSPRPARWRHAPSAGRLV
jgi:Glycosyltransferase family 87